MFSSSDKVGETGGDGDAALALRDSNWAERSNGDGFLDTLEEDAPTDVPAFGVPPRESSEASLGSLIGEPGGEARASSCASLPLPFDLSRLLGDPS